MRNKKFILIILDGWGKGNCTISDAICNGETPYLDSLLEKYPNSELLTSGEDVGLPDGQMGNSEVGHMNIGAGRVVYQDLVKINKAIKDNSISENIKIVEAFKYAQENNKAVHFIGLLSDGGVHSLDTHLYKLCDLTKDYNLDKVYIHAITDGRDTDPRSGKKYLQNLENHLKNSNGVIASLIGRYYTMDRDKRWERVKEGYDLMVNGKGEKVTDIVKAVENSYSDDITDEFIKPIIKVDENGNPIATIKPDDVVICFNYRTDRLREITTVLTQKDMPEFGMKTMKLNYFTMTRYDESFKNINVIYDKENVKNTLGHVISSIGKKQLRIAETEKFAHVTFFFSGGTDTEFEGEKRILIQSPKVATYDLQPEMSAYEVTAALTKEIKKQEFDLIVLNLANGDMVGHTGIYEAILKAVKAVDKCVKDIIETAIDNKYEALIIADHGNADFAVNDDGSPNTAHSLNPVPVILVSDRYNKINHGILADVAPTILKIMDIDIPAEMTGKVLVE
ncbi:MAG: 2,3-bisphosphoglycerate-independent phosphoglycerate mutase [Bacteroidales bacterium]|nr:2,3-bisphosphoglycerate-independent phosphoglycerate mutase [Bacteroidales bacterium]MBN2756608.1 2,3-bisphosphoglycerate-independent phosphoglycerate mutase [Bacteroidales bacterium]